AADSRWAYFAERPHLIPSWRTTRPDIPVQPSTFAPVMIVIRYAIAQGRRMDKPAEITNAKDGSQLILIPEGEFLMGSDDGYPSERPAHRVFVSSFYIAKNLVTNSQYRRFVLETGYTVPYLDDPRAEWANWDRENKR